MEICGICGKICANHEGLMQHSIAKHEGKIVVAAEAQEIGTKAASDPFGKNWDGECKVCGQGPTVQATGLCGPCTFGEADTIGGNW